MAAMQPQFDIWKDNVRGAVEAGRSFGVLHVEWHVKVDFFPMGDSALDQQTMALRQGIHLGAEPARPLHFSSAEDIVLRKLEWYRKSHEVLERQVRDVLGVLKHQGPLLDLPYPRRMAAGLDLSDLLERYLAQAGLA